MMKRRTFFKSVLAECLNVSKPSPFYGEVDEIPYIYTPACNQSNLLLVCTQSLISPRLLSSTSHIIVFNLCQSCTKNTTLKVKNVHNIQAQHQIAVGHTFTKEQIDLFDAFICLFNEKTDVEMVFALEKPALLVLPAQKELLDKIAPYNAQMPATHDIFVYHGNGFENENAPEMDRISKFLQQF